MSKANEENGTVSERNKLIMTEVPLVFSMYQSTAHLTKYKDSNARSE
jgi:hypothetical protein